MKNKITKALLLLIVTFFAGSLTLIAQEKKISKASKEYEGLDYVDAQKIYLTVAEKGYASEELFSKLGNSYYFNAQYGEAVKWYEQLFTLNPEPAEPVLLLRFSQALKATGHDKKAAEYFDIYIAKTGTNTKTAIDYQQLIEQNSDRYELQTLLGIYDENKISFGHTKLGNKLVYASTSESESFVNKKSAWDGLSFLSIYEVALDSANATIGKPRKLKAIQDSKFHESSPIFTKDGMTMYFTRSNITYKNKKNNQKLKIYRSRLVEDQWQEAEELIFNSDDYSSAHPALNHDETKLYFSSDKPGGYGQSDLYVASLDKDGTLGPVKNLGKEINTAGKETFPFVSANNELYFSSDGHFGLGGLDVFYIKITGEGFGNLLNIGKPVNSSADDFSFGIDETTKRGFISSNRSDVKGAFVYDNIYSFKEKKPIEDVFLATIEGHVTDKQTGKALQNATISLTDTEGKIYATIQTDEAGYYKMEINKYVAYYIKAEKEAYDTDEKVTKTNLKTQQIDFQLQQNQVPIETGTDLAQVLNIPIIYFDYDKWNIRPDAQFQLEKVLATLNEYPQIKLKIRSHTDSRGNNIYNLELSERRAKATQDYLVLKGVKPNRLNSEGVGEKELTNNCGDNINCSEEEHQKNRRSEFIIID